MAKKMSKPTVFTRYVLDERGEPCPEPSLTKWAQWFETAERHIALDELPNDVKVSTVFLGLDHNFGLDGPPILFETMIFGGKHDQYQDRYETRDEALLGHAKALDLARGAA